MTKHEMHLFFLSFCGPLFLSVILRPFFVLEQTITDLPSGGYEFTISIMGGDCGETEIFAFVKVNGETVRTVPMTVTVYDSWDTASVRLDSLPAGQTLTVGIAVKAEGEGRGAWGKIDAAALYALD